VEDLPGQHVEQRAGVRSTTGGEVGRGPLLWSPPPDAWQTSNLGRFARWVHETGRAGPLPDYERLWAWSVADLDGFWGALAAYAGIGGIPGPALADARLPGAEWFPGSRWNYAAEALGHATGAAPTDDKGAPDAARSARSAEQTALLAVSQTRATTSLTWAELTDRVRACRAGLVRLGVGPGDRVAGYLPNVPEAVVALLAAASLGAVWTCAPPEFGVRAVVDRLGQVAPKVLVAVEGYQYGRRRIDRREHLAAIRAALPSLAATVVVAYPDPPTSPGVLAWEQLLATTGSEDAGRRGAELDFAPVEFSHPLVVLYSSGTTGPPKAIVHGHGGLVCEHVKVLSLHHDLGPGDRFFWFSTTGWMMWNYLVSGLLVGASVVLFDGDPAADGLGTLWRVAAETAVSFFGVSAPFLDACRRADLDPSQLGDFAALRGIGSTGAPLSAAAARWATTATGARLPVSSISGGTDVCTAFVGGSPVHPVRAGEIACRYLGADVQSWVGGQAVLDRQGELVVARPLPSMPVALWGDADGSRLRATYFSEHPGVWTHGDWITLHADGSCVISGRADATLNRAGVRLGTAEIYAVVEELPGVADSLVVHLDRPEGTDELLLLVVPSGGGQLDEDLVATIREALRSALSPRHSPDRVVAVPAVPRTLSGKKLEVPVKRILCGEAPDDVVERDGLADPSALDAIVALASQRRAGPAS